MRILTSAALAAAVIGWLGLTPAVAGLDKLHKQRVEGGRVCMSNHWHYKSSGAWPSRDMAHARVIQSWSRFTAAEYGAAWSDVRLAADVKLDCAATDTHRRTMWSCTLAARPCRH